LLATKIHLFRKRFNLLGECPELLVDLFLLTLYLLFFGLLDVLFNFFFFCTLALSRRFLFLGFLLLLFFALAFFLFLYPLGFSLLSFALLFFCLESGCFGFLLLLCQLFSTFTLSCRSRFLGFLLRLVKLSKFFLEQRFFLFLGLNLFAEPLFTLLAG
jgi:hypothetical protein